MDYFRKSADKYTITLNYKSDQIMTKEEKDLLTKDICARLPYGLKLDFYSHASNEHIVCTLLGIEPESDKPIIAKTDNGAFTFTQDHVKPYLRPMSSMTEKVAEDYFKNSEYESSECYEAGANCEPVTVKAACSADEACVNTDWLNAHHFDYRGLIEKGLALEAPEGMYKTKTE